MHICDEVCEPCLSASPCSYLLLPGYFNSKRLFSKDPAKEAQSPGKTQIWIQVLALLFPAFWLCDCYLAFCHPQNEENRENHHHLLGLLQSFSTSALVTFWTGSPFCGGDHPGDCRLFSSITGLPPTRCQEQPQPSCDNWKCVQTLKPSPAGQNHSQLKIPGLLQGVTYLWCSAKAASPSKPFGSPRAQCPIAGLPAQRAGSLGWRLNHERPVVMKSRWCLPGNMPCSALAKEWSWDPTWAIWTHTLEFECPLKDPRGLWCCLIPMVSLKRWPPGPATKAQSSLGPLGHSEDPFHQFYCQLWELFKYILFFGF